MRAGIWNGIPTNEFPAINATNFKSKCVCSGQWPTRMHWIFPIIYIHFSKYYTDIVCMGLNCLDHSTYCVLFSKFITKLFSFVLKKSTTKKYWRQLAMELIKYDRNAENWKKKNSVLCYSVVLLSFAIRNTRLAYYFYFLFCVSYLCVLAACQCLRVCVMWWLFTAAFVGLYFAIYYLWWCLWHASIGCAICQYSFEKRLSNHNTQHTKKER